MYKIISLFIVSLPIFAQSNSIQLCDQQATRHCLSLKAPAIMSFSPAPITVSGKDGALLLGIASTDMSLSVGDVVAGNGFVAASAPTNASIISMAVTPFSLAGPGADISVGKTGTGTMLPMRFFRNPQEVMRIDVSNRLLVGITASDVGTGLGSVITRDSVSIVSGPSDASLLSLGLAPGSYVAIGSQKTGTGSILPITFWTGPSERLRIETTGAILVNRTGNDGTGAMLQVQGSLSSSGVGGLSITKTVRNSAGTGTCTITFTGGLMTASTC